MCDLKFRDFDNILCIECCELQMFAFWKLSTQACIIDIDGTYMTLGTVGDTVSFMVTSRQEMDGGSVPVKMPSNVNEYRRMGAMHSLAYAGN